MDLTFYSPPRLACFPEFMRLEGMASFFNLFKIVNSSVMFLDRTGTIRTPVRSKNLFPLREIGQDKGYNYGDIMLLRARSILDDSERLRKPIGLLWSGGIDSTAVLVALMRVAPSPEYLRERVEIFMSAESIQEYPLFFHRYVVGRFKIHSSSFFFDFFQGSHLLVTGEGNDQLFGSDLVARLVPLLGPEYPSAPFTDDRLLTYLRTFSFEKRELERLFTLFRELAKKCPSGVRTCFDFFWWLNFSCKWQSVYMRMLGYISPLARKNVSADFIRDNYRCFFFDERFENWSVWNSALKIGKDWSSYKLEAKKFILEFTGDQVYFENKIKVGSLFFLLQHQRATFAIDGEFRYRDQLDFEQIYHRENSFL